jgi:hypothetical protein
MTDLVGEEKKSEAVFCPSPFLSFFVRGFSMRILIASPIACIFGLNTRMCSIPRSWLEEFRLHTPGFGALSMQRWFAPLARLM